MHYKITPIEATVNNMKRLNTIYLQLYHSPCGDLMLGSFEDKLCLCDWVTRRHKEAIYQRLQRNLQADYEEEASEITLKASRQLDEYFRKQRSNFDLPLLFTGTVFQKKVWNKLLEIPYGKTVSYRELACQLDIPNAVRAVANANGANAISIFVPCHRVIGSNHTLTGYAGGLEAKKMLLTLEND